MKPRTRKYRASGRRKATTIKGCASKESTKPVGKTLF
jgi:hypothetical protein